MKPLRMPSRCIFTTTITSSKNWTDFEKFSNRCCQSPRSLRTLSESKAKRRQSFANQGIEKPLGRGQNSDTRQSAQNICPTGSPCQQTDPLHRRLLGETFQEIPTWIYIDVSDSNIFYLSVALVFNQEEYGFYLKQRWRMSARMRMSNHSLTESNIRAAWNCCSTSHASHPSRMTWISHCRCARHIRAAPGRVASGITWKNRDSLPKYWPRACKKVSSSHSCPPSLPPSLLSLPPSLSPSPSLSLSSSISICQDSLKTNDFQSTYSRNFPTNPLIPSGKLSNLLLPKSSQVYIHVWGVVPHQQQHMWHKSNSWEITLQAFSFGICNRYDRAGFSQNSQEQ